jgi:hypothetical protein
MGSIRARSPWRGSGMQRRRLYGAPQPAAQERQRAGILGRQALLQAEDRVPAGQLDPPGRVWRLWPAAAASSAASAPTAMATPATSADSFAGWPAGRAPRRSPG